MVYKFLILRKYSIKSNWGYSLSHRVAGTGSGCFSGIFTESWRLLRVFRLPTQKEVSNANLYTEKKSQHMVAGGIYRHSGDNNKTLGSGEMAQLFRELAALPLFQNKLPHAFRVFLPQLNHSAHTIPGLSHEYLKWIQVPLCCQSILTKIYSTRYKL